ncbi:putative bifunctional diguanylate cyclase/phosphodiesterase [Methyloglobulus sp.]|uniref:putative bifunctional diguanylate cyclase/phosphodiesterase n=1 Tax=Methyloglobulus sp. TaxID=2518622 RepID=UPI003988BB11
MVLALVQSLFTENVRLLKSEASKTAYQGVAIAITTIIIATSLVCYFEKGTLSLEGLWAAQKHNVALWMLNFVPFVFGFWGQYSNSLIAYQAGAMIVNQTQELRTKADDLEKQTAYVTTHDRLTDLPNRALFYDRVERAIISAISSGNQRHRLSILLIEIENFNDIYDALGRNSSDLILKQISTRLQGVSLERDDVAKIDGNIFGVLLSEISDVSRAEEFARQIQKTMESPFNIYGLHVAIHPNVGIVHFPEHGEDVDALVQRAGVALHIAQKSNKGYATYEPSFDKHTPFRLTLISELRHAIERDGLELFYQPQVSIKTGEICGVEALVRWNHPVHGFVPPDEFVAMAERNRMINQLTQWVLKRAFRDCANWHKQGLPIKISVNLSVKDLHNPELPDLISGVAVATGIKPEWIILEITESSVMTEPERALEIIQRLNQMGYQFSIDDFGTGYSSLAYLKKLPLTEIKIDKSFVMDILTSENDAAIVKATVNLGHNLGLMVTAEGVESKEIMSRLMDYGCDVAQGYFLSKPVSVQNFNQWVSDSHWKIADHSPSPILRLVQ